MSTQLSAVVIGLGFLLTGCALDRNAGTEPDPSSGSRPSTITYGFPDDENTYSNVGAFIVQDPDDGLIYPICSGTLIAPTVFLTAAHCTLAYTRELAPLGFTVAVSFDSPIGWGPLTEPKTRLIPVTRVVTNPAFNQRQSDPGDIGVLIVASRDTRGVTPAALPTLGLLDRLAAQGILQGAVFTAVGYGVQNRVVGGGVPYHQDLNPIPRMYAFSSFNSLGPGYLRLSQNPATGDGGTCFGDSGGPNFLEVSGTQILVASTVTGDQVCRSTNVDYRLDTSSARAFLGQFVALP